MSTALREAAAGGEPFPAERLLEFLEVRRHWFTGPVEHDTRGTET